MPPPVRVGRCQSSTAAVVPEVKFNYTGNRRGGDGGERSLGGRNGSGRVQGDNGSGAGRDGG